MRTLALIAVAALCLAACASRPPDADPKRAAIAGTWILVDGYLDGQKVSEEDRQRSRITWTGNRMSTASPQLKSTAVPYLSAEQIVATIAVDPTTGSRLLPMVRGCGQRRSIPRLPDRDAVSHESGATCG